MEWLISANHKYFDYSKAFKELPYIDWIQNVNYDIGDKVFIYSSAPISSIEILSEVIEINLDEESIIDQKEYWLNEEEYEISKKKDKYVRLKLIKEFNDNQITLEQLRLSGLKGNIQGPRRFYGEDGNILPWAKYILEFNSTIKTPFINEDDNRILSFPAGDSYDFSILNRVHAHPIKKGYPTKVPLHIALRKAGGDIEYIFKVVKIIDLDPNEPITYKHNLNDIELNNLKRYIKMRKELYTFTHPECKYRFYILDLDQNIIPTYKQIPNSQGNKYYDFNELIDKEVYESIKYNDEQDKKLIDNIVSTYIDVFNDLTYTGGPVDKPKLIEYSSKKAYKRNLQVAINALAMAHYKCEINSSHESFTRKRDGLKYMEPHHLIPMAFQYKYEHSIDIEENIVSLCSNCHNEIHYGINAKDLIINLYNQRKDLLRAKGIDIEEKELLSFYNIT